jgi:predicted nucleotidyltransferase
VEKTAELRAVAQRVAAALPPFVEEIVLTGSVSRGVADELSDVEMLLVSEEVPPYEQCVAHATAARLGDIDAWVRLPDARHIGGVVDGVGFELVWWTRARVDERVRAIRAAEITDGRLTTADALVHGVALRSAGLLEGWQELLREYPSELTPAIVDDATSMWRGYQPAGMLTVMRRGERLALMERLVEDAQRTVRIVFAVNRVWQPTAKRLASRVESLMVKPPRLAERIEDALTEPEPRAAVRTMYELAAETLALVPDEIDVEPPRAWVAEVVELVG